jgi:hypothetical protein
MEEENDNFATLRDKGYYTLLKGHINEDTAKVVANYPYGFRLRTSIRYWIETDKKKGDRFVSQTLNPKTNKWNNPKKSVYNSVKVMYENTQNGHIGTIGLYPTTSKEDIESFENRIKGYELSAEQKEQLKILKAYSRAMENVEWKISARRYRNTETGEITESVDLMEIEKYEEVKDEDEGWKDKNTAEQTINKMVAYEYVKGED